MTRRKMRQFIAMLFALCCASAAPSQTTNSWILNANSNWSEISNWFPNTNYPDSVGAVAFITNNISLNRILTIDTNVTIGALIWGDINRDRQMDLRTNAAGARITFDTGDDGQMAVISHASGDVAGRDIGNDSDDTDVGITVADAQGLYIDAFRNITFGGRTFQNAIFDGGGHDIVKGEDGTVLFQRIMTNVGTIYVRDGGFRVDPEGREEMKPDIGLVVLGVAPDVIDAGEMNPMGTLTNSNEASARDRRQFPIFEYIGAAATNTAVVMTNDFDMVINRGIFRSYNRRAWTNGAVPAVYTGTFTLNGDANEVFFQIESDSSHTTNLVLPHIFAGTLTGSGGFSKWTHGEMVLANTNDFTGEVNVLRSNDRTRGTRGGLRLQDNGTMSGVSAISLQRDGELFIDNSGLTLSNRINDAAPITTWGRSQIEFVGNASSDTYERLGITTVTNGRLAIEFDSDDASPRAHTLEFTSLNRARGTVVGFHASDVLQGAFASNGPGSITLNLLDGGAWLEQIGSGGGVGATNRSVVVGVFGGDGVDSGVDKATRTPDRSDEFMTVDGGRLRTLRADEMVYLGGGSTNPLLISQASAASDANVNINFESEFLNFSTYSITNALNQTITKRVVGDSTFNSIRFGIVRGDPTITGTVTNNPTDLGRSLLMDDGVRLTSESGMLLFGRDTTSTNGDVPSGGNILIYNGTIDLDGTSNNREGIIHNDASQSVYLRSSIEASQGLTKSGQSSVVLDVANQLGGTVSIAQTSLYVRHGGALNGATDVRLSGDGVLVMAGGAIVTNDIRLTRTPMPYGNRIIYSESGHNLWAGDIAIDNTDNQALTLHDMRLGAGINSQNATLTLLGDIGRIDGGTTSDIYMIDSPQVSTVESSGILNLKGTFGDRLDENGNAVPYDPTGTGQGRTSGGYNSNRAANENDVLRFRIDGPSLTSSYGDELVVNIYKPWNSAGRIDAQQGTIRFLGDPSIGEGEFWTSNAVAVSDFANGQSGFRLGGSGTDRNGSVTVLLTKDGQAFNAKLWSADQANDSDNTITIGLEHLGPSNVTVTIGNNINDPNPTGSDNRITFGGASSSTVRELRMFSHAGYDSLAGSNTVGTVNVINSLNGGDNGIFTKVGSGVVAFQAGTNLNSDENNDIRKFRLLGGELVLDRRSGQGWATDLRRTTSTSGRGILETSGGDLTHLGANGNTTEWIHSNLVVRAGDSTIATVGGTAGTTELFLGTAAGANTTRGAGGTIQFVEDTALGGAANIRFGAVPAGARIGSWATYGTNRGGGAYTWAATDALSNVVEFAEGGYQVNTFGAGVHTHLDTVPGVPVIDEVTASLRYTNATALDLNGFSLDVTEGGILVTPTVAGAASIDNGGLTSSGGELIIHNYADAGGSLALSAGITGAVDLTFSGTGRTVLSGTNTFSGVTRINGGSVVIDHISRLGSGTANIEFRGGTLVTLSSVILTNRAVILGGDGGTFEVAAGTTNLLGQVRSEENFMDADRMNNGHGDLIKTGDGLLELRVGISDERTQTTQTYQGITDIRSGTLRSRGGALGLGTSKSFYDGTVVRTGATLALGSNFNNSAYNIREWLTMEEGSTLRIERQTTSYSSPGVDGVINLVGDATIWVEAHEADLHESAGYLMGSGDLIKDGGGGLRLLQYSPEFTGGIVVVDANLEDHGYGGSVIPNASSITIGLNDGVDRGTVGFNARGVERNAAATTWEITPDIFVQGNSSGLRLGVRRAHHNDVVNFTGDINLSNMFAARDFHLYFERDISQRDANGGDGFNQEAYVNLTGDISGGSRRIRTLIEQVGGPYTGWTQTQERVEGSQALTNEPNFMTFWTLSGSNADWTGSLEVGNRESTSTSSGGPDMDKQHFVRFGNNDGAVSYAIGATNQVILRHNATLQAYGSQVTLGNLYSDGNASGSTTFPQDGFWGSQGVSNSYLENGGTVAGSFTIYQTTNRAFSGVVRDGTFYSPTTSNLASAPLSLIKDGPGALALNQSNYYTGTTLIRGGDLNVDGVHVGGGTYSVLNGGALGGTGIVVSSVQVADGGGLTPGSVGMATETLYGALTIDGDLSLSPASLLRFDLAGNDLTPGGTDPFTMNDLIHVTGALTLDGTLDITPSAPFFGPFNTNADFWTLFYYDGALTNNMLDISSASQALIAGEGYMFYIDYQVLGEVRLGVMIPEPTTGILLGVGLGLLVWLRRRKEA